MDIHYLSDFALTLSPVDADGHAIPPGAADFAIEFSTGSLAHRYTASRRGATLVNCDIVTTDGAPDGSQAIRVNFRDHGLSPGDITARWTVAVPDASFPTGIRRVTFSRKLDGVRLVRTGGCTEPPMEGVAVRVILPFIYADAYRLAAEQGYAGEPADYARALMDVPEAVAGAKALAALAAETASGKAAVADALTAQGVPTDADAPLASMAEGVRSLYAVPTAEAGAVDSCLHHTEADVTAAFDIRNIVGRHRRAEFPHICGATFALSGTTREVTLPACDAVVLSDGTSLHDVTPGTVITLDGTATAGWAVFHFREDFFAWPWLGGVVHYDLCAIGSHPCFSTSTTQSFMRLLTDADPADYEGHDFAFASGAGDIADSAVEALPSGSSLVTGPAIRSLCLANLKSSRRTIANNCANLTRLELPTLQSNSGSIASSCANLTRLELPALQSASGTIASSCAALTHLELPALQSATTAIIYKCPGITTLECPALTEFILSDSNTAFLQDYHVTYDILVLLPALVKFIGNCTYYIQGRFEFVMPALLDGTLRSVYLANNVKSAIVTLGSQHGANIKLEGSVWTAINILPGFTGNLTFSNATAITADNLRTLLANLGDNSDGPTYRIQMGATNLAKLTDEEIAVATAKNYTLS